MRRPIALFVIIFPWCISAAYKHADGKKIDGKRVLVDVERARTVKGWLPRRLGGGLGGTRRGGADVNIKHSGREDNERERERYRAEQRHLREHGEDRGRQGGTPREHGASRRRSRSRSRRRSSSRSRRPKTRDEEEPESRRRRRSRSRSERRRSRRDKKRSRRSRDKEHKLKPDDIHIKQEPLDDYSMEQHEGLMIKQEPPDETKYNPDLSLY